jgi:hypothetical protein
MISPSHHPVGGTADFPSLTGYDTGVMGSVLALASFKQDFGLPSDTSGFSNVQNAQLSSNVV